MSLPASGPGATLAAAASHPPPRPIPLAAAGARRRAKPVRRWRRRGPFFPLARHGGAGQHGWAEEHGPAWRLRAHGG